MALKPGIAPCAVARGSLATVGRRDTCEAVVADEHACPAVAVSSLNVVDFFFNFVEVSLKIL